MPRRLLRAATVALALCLSSIVAFGQSSTPAADVLTYSNNPNTNYGSYTSLFVQKGSITSTSYIKFDLGMLPASSTISKATLRLFVNQVAANGSFDVYQLNNSWSEATLTYNNAPPLGTSATGNHPVAFTANSVNQYVLIDVTSLVQAWVSGSLTNNGLALGLTTASGAIAFDSKESIYTSHQPDLEIALNGGSGQQGPPGPPGPQGPIGLTGSQGPTGLTGAQGQQGATGATGAQGAQGAQGPIGLTGARGPQGPIGLTGPMGPQGAQGAPGTSGTNGANGIGFTFRGPFNVASNYNAYDVVTYNGSSYDATVAIAPGGNTPDLNASWQLMAQSGSAGTAGAQGPAGPQGPIGLQGPSGSTGAQGPQGPIGLTGAQGPQGPQGASGTNGTNGANGTGFNFTGPFNVATNYNPYDVVTYNGSTYNATVTIAAGGNTPDLNASWQIMAQAGATGAMGAAGAQGATGGPGPAGPQGPQGVQGPQGPPGSNATVTLAAICTALQGGNANSQTLQSLGCTIASWPVGGTVSGLTGTLVLTLNGASALNISTNGAFTFGQIATGTSYIIAVSSQPSGQICSVANGSGVSGPSSANATTVSCVALQATTYPMGASTFGIAWDGNNLWVTTGGNVVDKVNPSNGQILQSYATGNFPNGVLFDGNNIWVANAGSGDNSVTELNDATGTLINTYTVGTTPVALAFDGTYIWAANNGSATVTKLRASDGTIIGSYPAGISPIVVVFDGTHIWVCDKGGNSLTEIDPATGVTLQTVAGFNNSEALAFDGSNLWMGSNPGMLYKISLGGSILATYSVGSRLRSLTFDGVNLWGIFDQTSQAVEINISNGSIINTYSTGTQPVASVFDGHNLWTANSFGASITQIPVR